MAARDVAGSEQSAGYRGPDAGGGRSANGEPDELQFKAISETERASEDALQIIVTVPSFAIFHHSSNHFMATNRKIGSFMQFLG